MTQIILFCHWNTNNSCGWFEWLQCKPLEV